MTNNFISNETPIVGKLSIISMKGCEGITAKIDEYLRAFRGYEDTETYVTHVTCPRFGTGEGKCVIDETVRGHDVYIICDVFNYGVTYKMYGFENHMSPDDHYQDLKRVIAAMGGKARRVTVVMPMLYEGRQHRRNGRESLDAALMLQELVHMGVSNIITFDAHDPRISNAIPLAGFDDVQATYQMIKALVRAVPDISLNKKDTIVISPDEGGMSRCMYYSSVLKLDLGMFYKRRDYSVIVNGKNPIEAHEYLGRDVNGKDVIIVDDMISSANYDIESQDDLKTSPNYLSDLLLDTANVPKNEIENFTSEVRNDVPQINAMGHYDSEGNWVSRDEDTSNALDKYEAVEYYMLTRKENKDAKENKDDKK